MEIDKNQFENLCSIQCTLKEIADWFRCNEDDIRQWTMEIYNEDFDSIYEKKSVAGKISLRRAQFKLAEKNANMAMWLGRQYLGQTVDGDCTDNEAINPNSADNISSLDSIRNKFKIAK